MKVLRILVVEDDALIGTLLAEMLEEMGHEVCGIEATETDAVVAAARERPDLMIVDARLRQGSGICAIEQVLRIGPMPYLFTSGDALRVRAQRPEAVTLQKPFDEAELARAIRLALIPTVPDLAA